SAERKELGSSQTSFGFSRRRAATSAMKPSRVCTSSALDSARKIDPGPRRASTVNRSAGNRRLNARPKGIAMTESPIQLGAMTRREVMRVIGFQFSVFSFTLYQFRYNLGLADNRQLTTG